MEGMVAPGHMHKWSGGEVLADVWGNLTPQCCQAEGRCHLRRVCGVRARAAWPRLPPVLHPQLSPAAWRWASSRLSRSQGRGGDQWWNQPTSARQSARQHSSPATAELAAAGAREAVAMSSVLYYALPALGSYAVLSIFFLRRPRLLHTPGVPAFCPRLGAHRGGSGERLENTMEAMENAMAQRSDLLELDCQLTRDGVVVVSHDENLSRQSGVNKDVGSLDFEELPLYKEELEVYFSPGHFAHGSDRHMVRLEDVFQRFPRMPVSVEVKEENEKLIHKIASLVRHFDRNEITIWASEKSSIMKKCKAANPEMPLSFTRCRVIRLLLLYYLGLLPFVPIPEKFLLCFLPTIINRVPSHLQDNPHSTVKTGALTQLSWILRGP
ncbi:PREDICTED: glycerophosphodiester phosphodiesterase domain-containing protein 3 isoform X2 [Myotis brandtii]|uniref:glycerophosphodiester phosphodiesterase domain-containing protein 3 isoform X2 n=1 Tax=Myotis brandtii TaxID=109478 RepID=UPI0003BBB55D|nr:PREDICTED: glycerophosphodiester phosphodiesterase domain-containing protein 3 isoform X2 [Myotis brandtii]